MNDAPVIIDTNVFVSGFKSRNGNSFKFLNRLLAGDFKIAISTPLIIEYELALIKSIDRSLFSVEEIQHFINYICEIGVKTKIYYLWRPFLKDPYDDHILEIAVAANSQYIISFNRKDFSGIERFGISVIDPNYFLKILGGNV